MRLFSSLAYYVKLIQQTIVDSGSFMLMVTLIILAFANYFYVIDKNLRGLEDDPSYYENYVDNDGINSIISIYFLGALGDFDSGAYTTGYDKFQAFFMFTLATFLIAVVFMNMLIAIMGETFGDVLASAEESGLNEQVVLINDHAWLLNLKKIFKNQKYIIRLEPSTSSSEEMDKNMEYLKDVSNGIHKHLSRV